MAHKAARAHAKGRAFQPAPILTKHELSGLQNRHDLVGVRIDDHDLLLDQDKLISSPFRIDRDDSLRQGLEGHVARNAGADRDREVHIRLWLNVLLLDHAGDLGALLGRELRASASLSSRLGLGALSSLRLGGGLRLAVRRALLLRGGLAFTALGLHVLAFAAFGLHVLAFAAFGLHVLLAFAPFSLHLLATLGAFLLRAHALRLLALHVLVFGALAFRRAR